MLELENGDQYGVPFFFFAKPDREILEQGWKRWSAANDDTAKQEEESFYLRAQAEAKQQELQQLKQIAQLNLQIGAYDAGLFDLWEVTLYPPRGGRPMTIVVPGRDSREATQTALQKYPTARVGAVAKARRRGRRIR